MKHAHKVTELSPAQAPRDGLTFTDPNGDARGYCYCCGRIGFKVDPAGRLSRHGFTRPRWAGFTTGACYGTKHTPEQTLDLAIRGTRESLERLAELLATDLRAHAIRLIRLDELKTKARAKWLYRRGYYTRIEAARKLRSVRNGTGLEGYGGKPASWSPAGRRLELLEDVKAAERWLAELLEVKRLAGA